MAELPASITNLPANIVCKFIGDDLEIDESNVESNEEDEVFQQAGALEPPFDLRILCSLFGHSNSLRPNVDAYATNIDAFGHRFDPIIDLRSRDADEKISDGLFLEALDMSEDPENLEATPQPTDDDIATRRKKLAIEQRIERHRLDVFFDFCCIDESFTGLRRQTRQDLEVTGNGYWECLRSQKGRLAQFTYMPSFTVRLMPLDKQAIEVDMRIRTSPFSFKSAPMRKRFRRYVQAFQTRAIYFKELGDPRTISNKTGRVYKDKEALEAAENQQVTEGERAKPATEILHFSIHNPESSYGVPRWIGTLLAVLGSRQSEEVNFLYFDNKSIPPMAIMVSGGSLSKDSVERLRDFIKNNIRGRRNFHSIMIIEAETGNTKTDAENAGRVKIDMKPLTGAQHNDALFQKYDERNIDKVGMAFRMPRMLRGDIRDFNRSCYSEDTETLTESGWKRWFEIGEDEKIAAFDPDTGRMEFVVPAEKHVYPVENEQMWRFHNAHTDCLVTYDHKMLVRNTCHDCWEQFEASKIPYDQFDVRLVPDLCRGKAIPKTRPMEFLRVLTDELRTSTIYAREVYQEQYTGMVYCFSVPSHGFFVTRRNGKVAIQGNTADAALNFAEMQVFQPERENFDFIINRRILLQEFGTHSWRFMSNAPVTRNPEIMANIIRNLANANVLTPELGLQLTQDVFNKVFTPIDADWTKQPVPLTVAGIPVNAPLDVDAGPTFDPNDPRGDGDDAGGDIEPEDDPDDFLAAAFGKGDLSTGNLAAAGVKQPVQGRKLRRQPPKIPATTKNITKWLIGIRKALIEQERRLAEGVDAKARSQLTDDNPS